MNRGFCYSCSQVFRSQARAGEDQPRCSLCGSDFVEIVDSPETVTPSLTVRVTNLGESTLAREVGSSVLPAFRAAVSAIIAENPRAAVTLERLARQLGGGETPAASQALVDSLPRRISEGREGGEGASHKETCAVCHDDYAVGDRLVDLPCGHFFHEGCILPWLREHDTCPVCRQVLSEQQGAREVVSGRGDSGEDVDRPLGEVVRLAARGRLLRREPRLGAGRESVLMSRIQEAESELDSLETRLATQLSEHERLQTQIHVLHTRRSQLQQDYRRQSRRRMGLQLDEITEIADRTDARLAGVHMSLDLLRRRLGRVNESSEVPTGTGSRDLSSNGGDTGSEGS